MNSTNQFFYKRTEVIPPSADGTEQVREYIDSFNLNKVIRSVEDSDGTLIVLLDDIHQRIEAVPIYSKQNRMTGTKNQTVTYQSQIILKGEDIKRFREACGYQK